MVFLTRKVKGAKLEEKQNYSESRKDKEKSKKSEDENIVPEDLTKEGGSR